MLTNPFDQNVIVDISFATDEGTGSRRSCRGSRSPRARCRSSTSTRSPRATKPQVAVQSPRTRGDAHRRAGPALPRGRAPRLQHDAGVPVLRSQWWFANGLKGAGVTERYSIYNPGDDDVQVQPLFLGLPTDNTVRRRCQSTCRPASSSRTPPTPHPGCPTGATGCSSTPQDAGQTFVDRAGDHPHDRRHPDDIRPARRPVSRRGRPTSRTCGPSALNGGADGGHPDRLQHDERRCDGDGAGGHARRTGQRALGLFEAAVLPAAEHPARSRSRPRALDAQLVLQSDGAGVRRALDPAGTGAPGRTRPGPSRW